MNKLQFQDILLIMARHSLCWRLWQPCRDRQLKNNISVRVFTTLQYNYKYFRYIATSYYRLGLNPRLPFVPQLVRWLYRIHKQDGYTLCCAL